MSPEELEAILDLRSILASTGHRVVLVGAYARETVFDRALGGVTHRATRDVDFAIRVASWTEFESIATALTTTRLFRRMKEDGIKFLHENETELDLLPYGDITDEDDILRWPQEPQRKMSMAGFATIEAHATEEDLGGIVLHVADLPSLVALKLFAYADRSHWTSKDLEDLIHILDHATEVLFDRVYKELGGDLASTDYANYGALLLGLDLRTRLDDATLKRLLTIVRSSILRAPAYPELSRTAAPRRLDLDTAIQRFEALAAGMARART